MIARYEDACASAEQAAADLEQFARQLARLARQLRSAAHKGDATALRRFLAVLPDLAGTVARAADAAQASWPYDREAIVAYLDGSLDRSYVQELLSAAADAHIPLRMLEDRLVAFPVVVQVLPGRLAVRVDGRQHSALRPSAVVAIVRDRLRRPGPRPEQFIELLYRAYRRLQPTDDVDVRLRDVYDVLTLLPVARANYSRADFARDVFALDTSGLTTTRAGAQVSFRASTGVRAGADLTVITPEGTPKYYRYVRFKEATP